MPTQTNYSFRPVQGKDEVIQGLSYAEGYLYFATDTGRMYLDADGINKLPLGSSGAAVLYANAAEVTERADGTYLLNQSDLEDADTVIPKETDLIINIDGSFYKVMAVTGNLIQCTRIAVSGTGGGGGSGDGGGGSDTPISALVIKQIGDFPSQFVYGQPYIVRFEVNAPTDNQVSVAFTIQGSGLNAEPKIYTILTAGKSICEFDIGSVLPAESGLAITVRASGDNDGDSNVLRYRNRSAVEMKLVSSSNFNPLKTYQGVLNFTCIPYGNNLTLKVYVDNTVTNTLSVANSGQAVSVTVPAQSHGMHTLKAVLSTETTTGTIEADPLIYEIAWIEEGNLSPIIWLGEVPTEIVDHDKLNIQYMVYDPVKLNKTEINQYINDALLPTSPIEIAYSSVKWETWGIANYQIGLNKFTIECAGTNVSRSIEVNVTQDTERKNYSLVETGLLVKLDSAGRTNRENITSRQTWEYTDANNKTTAVKFNNFNWYNNGWITPTGESASCLRISNGASISIPLTVLGSASRLGNGLTFEFEFKLRNVTKYANLINVQSTPNPDGSVTVTKTVTSTEGVFAKYFNGVGNAGIGLCLGTQECFLKSKNAIVNGRYQEDDIVNVSFVVEAESEAIPKPLMYIYINGVCSGVINYLSNDQFDARLSELVINSDYCDVDLYKFRVYTSHLTSDEVVRNYIVDKADILMYDMNQICDYNNNIPYISFTKVEEYNREHSDNPTCPYAVLQVRRDVEGQNQDLLPYVKADDGIIVDVDFVNPSLDIAWENGDFESNPEAYVTGCPSFHSEYVEFNVQGTSSQGYPRRNYKGKWKKSKVWEYTNGPLKGKSLKEKNTVVEGGKKYSKFYMDNKDASEQSFTWKADFMESSGTHNSGFASFVKTLYSKHPLNDYLPDYVMGDHRTTIYGFPMMVFHKHWDGNYEFIGKYNFNLDKGCNNVIDFENETAHPYVEGTFVNDDGETMPLDFAHVAECWEVCNNQGVRTSFKAVNFEATDSDNNLTVLDDFEYRYNIDEDYIDAAIDRDASVAVPGGANGENFGDAEIANKYLLSKLANLQAFAQWLYDTDITNPTNRELPKPVVYNEKEYTTDSADYRKAKFIAEFTDHLDLEYCAIYFICTELLVQYDSRGKNMMLATWGPKKKGGPYVWYPIFYDIDTQLGVNNSGVPTWEYDVEPTKQSQFSTSNSVLWNNFYACFLNNIKNTYRELRSGKLTILNLNGYYNFNPEISKSYAMRGCRPLNMLNVDEYFKYIAPSYSGYINTKGEVAYDNGGYFYCLQGTRELHRAQFLRNRFNFVDSDWLGGSYSPASVVDGFKMRWNANDYQATSDRYIRQAPDISIEANKVAYEKFLAANGEIIGDEERPLNANVSFDIKPHLNQYCSVYFDQIPRQDSTPYNEIENNQPITINPTPEVQEQVDNTITGLEQQLVYIGGSEYIATLGDLSLKYPDELKLEKCVRIREILLGNEDSGYKNENLKTFEIDDSASSPNAKTLLETLILTNLGTMNLSLDVSGSEKLQTLRALGTLIPSVILATGSQIKTLYLPKTINNFTLVEPTQLSTILTERPVANKEGKFPEGLYIEDFTDAGEVTADSGSRISVLNLSGKGLNYNSYILAKKLVDMKLASQAKSDAEIAQTEYTKTLALNLENVNWTPYRFVEYGESIAAGATYVKKTDHYTYEDYTDLSTWDNDTLNGRVYEVNKELLAQSSAIKDLSLLDAIIDSEYFNSTADGAGADSNPYVSGSMFVDNDEPIDEEVIKNKYNKYFEDLTIYVKKVNKSYTAKFVEILDNGVEKEWGVKKYPKDTAHATLPDKADEINPTKLHYDFKGWVDSPSSSVVLTDTDMVNYPFGEDNILYTFYTYYELTTYEHQFHDPYEGTLYSSINNYLIDFERVEYGKPLHLMSTMPIRTHEDPLMDYKFIGWVDNKEQGGVMSRTDAEQRVVDLTTYISTKSYHFYPCYALENVHDYPTITNFFQFIPSTYDDIGAVTGYEVYPSDVYSVNSYPEKITLPVVTPAGAIDNNYNSIPAGIPVTGVIKGREYSDDYQRDFTRNTRIKYIYWQGGAGAQKYMTALNEFAFMANSEMKYFEFPLTLEKINNSAFRDCGKLQFALNDDGEIGAIPNTITSIGNLSFYYAFRNNTLGTLYIPSSVRSIGYSAFAYTDNIHTIQIGEVGSPTPMIPSDFKRNTASDKENLSFLQQSSDYIGDRGIKNFIVYAEDSAAWANELDTLEDKLGLIHLTGDIQLPETT